MKCKNWYKVLKLYHRFPDITSIFCEISAGFDRMENPGVRTPAMPLLTAGRFSDKISQERKKKEKFDPNSLCHLIYTFVSICGSHRRNRQLKGGKEDE